MYHHKTTDKMSIKRIAAAVLLMVSAATLAHAQLNLKALKDKAQEAAKKGLGNLTGNNNAGSSSSASSGSGLLKSVAAAVPAAKGKTYYVSATTGSARADGLSASTAMKDLQKAIDAYDALLEKYGGENAELDAAA